MPSATELRKTLKAYAEHNEEKELAKSTQYIYWRFAREYTLFLESSRQINNINDADAASVLAFLADISSRWSGTGSYHIVSNYRPFLKFLNRLDLLDALKLANVTRKHRIVPMLTDTEEEALAMTCCNRIVSARDAAIVLLALTTGMRACDIIDLRLGNIDWRTMTIYITQQKTGNPLNLPMVSAVAEAIAEYLLESRPKVENDFVFLRSLAPHTPFCDHSAVYNITKKAFLAAGIKGRAGASLLRHNAASKMLRVGVKLPVIASVLGHASPDSTNVYLEADEINMRACVLPLPKEVLNEQL
jgi:integrase